MVRALAGHPLERQAAWAATPLLSIRFQRATPARTMDARLPPHLWITAIRKRCTAAGIMATVLRRGNREAGDILLVARGRDNLCHIYTRLSSGEGWTLVSSAAGVPDQNISQTIEKKTKFDPDLWVLEIESADLSALLDERVA
jgi:hypothetical protein